MKVIFEVDTESEESAFIDEVKLLTQAKDTMLAVQEFDTTLRAVYRGKRTIPEGTTEAEFLMDEWREVLEHRNIDLEVIR